MKLFQNKKIKKAEYLVNLYENHIKKDLELAKTLDDLFTIHRNYWILGFQNKNLGPDPHGMFRTKDIAKMQPSEVFLGNIYGTYPLTYWSPQQEEYKIVFNQYKNILQINMEYISNKAKELLKWIKY